MAGECHRTEVRRLVQGLVHLRKGAEVRDDGPTPRRGSRESGYVLQRASAACLAGDRQSAAPVIRESEPPLPEMLLQDAVFFSEAVDHERIAEDSGRSSQLLAAAGNR